MSQRIALLPASAYFRYADVMREGRQALTHAALLRLDGGTQRYYVKCYGNAAKPLFNEIAGFLLGGAIKLPLAQEAALIALPGTHLDRIHPGRGLADQAHWLCWATRAIAASDGRRLPSATTHFNGHLSAIADDLRAWKHLPNLLAFDEWVANIDQNTGNLIRLAKSDYAIIDHGGILTGPDWVESLLAPVASYVNKLWSLLRSHRGLPLPTSNAALHAAQGFVNAYLESGPEMRAFATELLAPGDVQAADVFLRDRSLTIKNYLQRRLGVLL